MELEDWIRPSVDMLDQVHQFGWYNFAGKSLTGHRVVTKLSYFKHRRNHGADELDPLMLIII